MQNKGQTILLALGGMVVVGGLGWILWQSSSTTWTPEIPPAQKTNREVAMACTSDMATKFHIHPNLKIVINGTPQTIPAEVGITAGCMHPIHTHDTAGTLHVESPEPRDFTLADFFAIWGKPFSKDQILSNKVDTHHIIRETVNEKEVTDFENTVLRDNDAIVISYEEKKK